MMKNHWRRHGPLTVTLSFDEAWVDGCLVYGVECQIDGRAHRKRTILTEEMLATLGDPYEARREVRANLAKAMLRHLHSEKSCS
jgi:hypothetical protein